MSKVTVEFGSGEKIPAVDFTEFTCGDIAIRKATAMVMREAFEDFGFIYLKNHSVSQSVVDELFAQGIKFFNLPQTTKAKAGGYLEAGFRGLDPNKPADIREAFRSPYDGNLPPRYWPERLPKFRATISVFHEAGLLVLRQLMHGVALSLGLPEQYLDAAHEPHSGAVVLLHYPPITGSLLPGQLRSGTHTDFGTMTLLFHHGSAAGLEIQRPDGNWLHAPSVPGAVIVNVGDLLTRWTNGQFRSVLHRVVLPEGRAAQRSRYSATLFYQPRHEVVIGCLPPCQSPTRPAAYGPITVGEHLEARRRETTRSGFEN